MPDIQNTIAREASHPGHWEWMYSEEFKVWNLVDKMEGRLGYLEPRPSYCDRGHWVGNIEVPCGLDAADSWPNYYMSLERGKEEMMDFLKWRLFKIPYRME